MALIVVIGVLNLFGANQGWLVSGNLLFSGWRAETMDGGVLLPFVLLQIAELKKSAAKSDKKAISSVLHRIKPVWEMLGIESQIQPLRNVVKKRSATTADIESLVSDVISAMENLIKNISEELETIKDEEQDTDS